MIENEPHWNNIKLFIEQIIAEKEKYDNTGTQKENGADQTPTAEQEQQRTRNTMNPSTYADIES